MVFPIAETTTHTCRPSFRAAATRAATARTFSTSATDDPPNFCTTTFIAFLPPARAGESYHRAAS